MAGETLLLKRAGTSSTPAPDTAVLRATLAKPTAATCDSDKRGGQLKPVARLARGGRVPSPAARANEGPPSQPTAALEARKVALRGILDACSSSAPSPGVGGRDQGLVRRYPTRHHDVRHWITSFPLLSLLQQMAPHCAPVKGIPWCRRSAGAASRGWRRRGSSARPGCGGFPGAVARGRAGRAEDRPSRCLQRWRGKLSREPASSCDSSASERAP